jgi:hypothetical protein
VDETSESGREQEVKPELNDKDTEIENNNK